LLLANVIFKPIGAVFAIILTNVTKMVNKMGKEPGAPPQEPPPQENLEPPQQQYQQPAESQQPQQNFEFDEPRPQD